MCGADGAVYSGDGAACGADGVVCVCGADGAVCVCSQGLPNESWAFSRVNSSYQLCDTYPSLLVVPTCIPEDDLRRVAAFRAKHRLPVGPGDPGDPVDHKEL